MLKHILHGWLLAAAFTLSLTGCGDDEEGLKTETPDNFSPPPSEGPGTLKGPPPPTKLPGT
jgi:hypothetical protein